MLQFYFLLVLVFSSTSIGSCCCAQENYETSSQAISLDRFLQENSEDPIRAEIDFYRRDRDGDLFLSSDEKAGEATGSSPYERFSEFDTNKDQQLSTEEYTQLREKTSESVISHEFDSFDLDENELFSYGEFLESPPGANDPAVRFRRWDQNQDQKLTLIEYLKRFHVSKQRDVRQGFFYRDRNGDRRLTLEEFAAPAEEWQPHVKSRYAIFDTDDDLRVSTAEYVAPHLGKPSEEAADREASLFDKNQNEVLELEEFILTPHANLSPEEMIKWFGGERSQSIRRQDYLKRIPEPLKLERAIWFSRNDYDLNHELNLAELNTESRLPKDCFSDSVSQKIDMMEKIWFETDSDQDGTLTDSEFKLFCEMQSEPISNFLKLHVKKNYSWQSVEGLLEWSYGLTRRDGVSLRSVDGTVLNWAFVNILDDNSDYQISESEFIQNFFEGQNTSHHFQKFDADQNDRLDDLELVEQHLFSLNFIHDFCRWDLNSDGELTQSEIMNGVNPSQQPICENLIGAFDSNADDKLNLREFSFTPLANPLIDWYAPQKDLNQDSGLDVYEFYSKESTIFAALLESYFQKFDRDSDGQLTFDEFPVRLEIPKLSADLAWGILDQNQDQKFDAGDFKLLAHRGLEEFRTTDSRLMTIEDAIQFADQDGDGRLTVVETTDNWNVIRTAFAGEFDPSNPKRYSNRIENEENSGSIRVKTSLLIIFNILLLSGLATLAYYRLKAARL